MKEITFEPTRMRGKLYSLLNLLSPVFLPFINAELRVLAYHTVPDQKKFEAQLDFLLKNYNVIDINYLKKYFTGESVLPDKPVLITFDDGDISVFEKGLPVLKKLAVPAVIFVITGLINTSETFWCRWVEKVYEKRGLTYVEARKKVNELKRIPEIKRKQYLQTLEHVSGEQLSRVQLMTLEENGIFIGNHTHTHPMINNCTKAEIRNELYASKSRFQDWGLQGYPVFAYPNGNWDAASEAILKEEGIELAFLFDHKVNKAVINPLRISRIRVDSDLELDEFQVKVSGLHPQFLQMKQRLGKFISNRAR